MLTRSLLASTALVLAVGATVPAVSAGYASTVETDDDPNT